MYLHASWPLAHKTPQKCKAGDLSCPPGKMSNVEKSKDTKTLDDKATKCGEYHEMLKKLLKLTEKALNTLNEHLVKLNKQ